jgi:integrase
MRAYRTMNLEPYDDQDGMKVWLSTDEIERLLSTDALEEPKRQLAAQFGVRCGLRSFETTAVCPKDVVETDAGAMVRVWSGKGDKFRETPVPSLLAERVRTIDEYREEGSDEPLVDASERSLRRWVQKAREELEEETGDEGWQYLGYHDLRRTWATQLRGSEVDAMVVCDWGGWDDLETFLNHYRGTSTPEAQRREREKVEWL